MLNLRQLLPSASSVSVVFFLAIFAPSIDAQVASWPFDGPALSVSPAEMSAAAAKIPAEKFQPVTVLYEEDKDSLDAQGRLTKTHRLVYRIEAQEAVESWSEVAVEWEAFYQQDPAIRARVIRADSTVELDQKTITDVPARNQDNGTYSDDRIRKAPLPGLNVGAIVEEETVLTDKEPFFSGGGVYRTYFQRNIPIIRSRLIVEMPIDLPFDYHAGFLPDVSVTKEEAGGIRRIVFDQGHMAPSVDSDVDLATDVPRTPWVEFSTGKNWESIANSYRQLSEPQIKTEQVKDFVPKASDRDRLATIQRIVSQLHKEVRYTGIEFGQSALQPETPSEVIKRHYGDCKDKAALLVAMLRASSIPANLALLNAGPGRDVTPDLPGMNQFDHAIVYVPPAAPGDKPLWIDATAEFTQVGRLPFGDQGRLALIIAPGSHDLTRTPEAKPEDSILIETRNFNLAQYGPSQVIESSETSGYVDEEYRSAYGQAETKERKTALESYARRAYAAKALDRIEHGDARDFTRPFFLRLKMEKAAVGNTAIDTAYVTVYPNGPFYTLPRWFSTDPEVGNRKLTAEEESDKQKAEQQRSNEYQIVPFICERRYKIAPPPGFTLRSLPANKTTAMGPSSLSQTYTVDAAGIVTAVLRFDTGKSRFTVDEALALRKAVLEANKEDPVVIQFDQAGAKLMAAGKVREAFAVDQAAIDANATQPLPHIRMAYALLAAGVGDKARAEAVKAARLDPRSALAESAVGWTMQFNSIGVHFGAGFDYQQAVDAYVKAKGLDANEADANQIRANLAILYEYDSKGIRYSPDAQLTTAIKELRELKQQDKAAGEQYEDNLIFDMFYAHQYKEVLAEVDTLPASNVTNSIRISAIAATSGIDAALKRADLIPGDNSQRSTVLRNAGSHLINLNLYPVAAQILTASVQGQEDATATARQIEIFRNLHPFVMPVPEEVSPAATVRRMYADMFDDKLTGAEIERLLSRHAFASEKEWQDNLRKSLESAGVLRAVSVRSGLTPVVLRDLTLGSMKVSSEGDDASGYRVTVQAIGSSAEQYFVAKEDNLYRIVAGPSDVTEVGNAALYYASHGQEAEARSLLDWKRDQLHRGGGDDPLDGPTLPRFWTSGESKGPQNIQLASAALLANKEEVAALTPMIASMRDHWTAAQGKPDLTDLNLLLAEIYYHLGDAANARQASQALLKDYPDSITALRFAGSAYSLSHDWADWEALIDARLSKHPTDRDLLLQKERLAQYKGDFASAGKTLRVILDSGKALSNDYNNYAWNTLFENAVDEEAIQAAQQANMMSKNSSFSDLHTLSCLYASQGKTTEAKQVLFQAMAAANLDKPNSEAWFAFGAIYEQYGILDAAVDAFKKVEKPDGPGGPTDTYVLAQAHLKALHAFDQAARDRHYLTVAKSSW